MGVTDNVKSNDDGNNITFTLTLSTRDNFKLSICQDNVNFEAVKAKSIWKKKSYMF